jgi:hypothetical protein
VANRESSHAGFCIGLFFNPEDGGNIFLRKVGFDFAQTTRRYIPEDRTLHNHRCENLKFNKDIRVSSKKILWKLVVGITDSGSCPMMDLGIGPLCSVATALVSKCISCLLKLINVSDCYNNSV